MHKSILVAAGMLAACLRLRRPTRNAATMAVAGAAAAAEVAAGTAAAVAAAGTAARLAGQRPALAR